MKAESEDLYYKNPGKVQSGHRLDLNDLIRRNKEEQRQDSRTNKNILIVAASLVLVIFLIVIYI